MDEDATMLVRDLIAAGVDASLIVRVTGLCDRVAALDRRRAAEAARQRRRREKLATSRDPSRDAPHLPPHTPLSTPPVSKPLRVSRQARALPDDWEPDREFARRHGFTDERIAIEAQRFRDHALAKGCTYKDWNAAWRNWVRSPFQQLHNNGGGPHGPGARTMATAADDLITRAENFER